MKPEAIDVFTIARHVRAKLSQCTLTHTISLTSLVLLFLLRLGLQGSFFPLDFLTKKPLHSYSFPDFPYATPI
jgi:hypothetical protein